MNPTVTVIQPTLAEEKQIKIRVAAYCRVSSDSDDQINSFLAQTGYYENFLAESDTEILVRVYADEGITGTRMDKRDDFQRMLKDCRRGKIDRIVVKSISRFARNTKECLTVLRELKGLGISVLFEEDNIDTEKMTDEMLVTLMGGLAQEESMSISQNMRWSIQKRMQNGTFHPASLPYGYKRINGEVKISEESKIVKRIFHDFLSGIGMENIACQLNAENQLKGNHSVRWCKNTVRYILTNEKYTGDSIFQKYYTKSQFPFQQKRNDGEMDQYLVTNSMPVIISKEEFNMVEKIIQKRAENTNRTKGNDYVFSGKIFCGNCGKIFRHKVINQKECWVCTNHNLKAEYCKIKGMEQEIFYSAFIRLHNKLLCHYKQILIPLQSALQDLRMRRLGSNSSIVEIYKEIADLKEQIHVLTRLKTKGYLDEVKYLKQTTELTAKINRQQMELKKLTCQDDEDDVLNQLEILIDYFENQKDMMIQFEKDVFENLIDKIVVKEQRTLEFYLIGGLKFTENDKIPN